MTPVNYVKKVFLQGKYIEIHFYYIENVLPQTEDNHTSTPTAIVE